MFHDLVWLIRETHGQNDLGPPGAVCAVVHGMLHAGGEQTQTEDALTGTAVYTRRDLKNENEIPQPWTGVTTRGQEDPLGTRVAHCGSFESSESLPR